MSPVSPSPASFVLALAAFAAACAAFPLSAGALELVLVNGKRVSGRVQQADESELHITISSATIKLRRSSVDEAATLDRASELINRLLARRRLEEAEALLKDLRLIFEPSEETLRIEARLEAAGKELARTYGDRNSAPRIFLDKSFEVEVTPDIIYDTSPVRKPRRAVASLMLDLYQPRGESPTDLRPAFIYIHGGAFRAGDKSSGRFFAEEFAARGYVAASINYRLERDDPPTDGEYSKFRAVQAATQDAAKAVRWFRLHAEQYGVDPERIAIGGVSAGAATAMVVGFLNEVEIARVQAVMDVSGGIYDYFTRFRTGAPPAIIIHGSEDTGVNHAHLDTMMTRAKANRIPIELHVVEGAGHGLRGYWTEEIEGSLLIQKVADFFYENLKLGEL